ncbi:THUMP domain-containing protein 3 [Dissophora globulifera]|nr:THUMP domain-containing protein 3 [Dissophora globulifera]
MSMAVPDLDQDDYSVKLFLSVLAGLEDTAVKLLPQNLLNVATEIHYKPGSGYVSVHLGPTGTTAGPLDHVVTRVLAELVQRPPLCLFAAYISIGEIPIPQDLLESSTAFEEFIHYKFKEAGWQRWWRERAQQDRIPLVDNNNDSYDKIMTYSELQWQHGLDVLKSLPHPLAHRLGASGREETAPAASNKHDPFYATDTAVTFRASFDRGTIKHAGVRSEDYAAALGDMTGKVFTSWRVDLKKYDIEIYGRWVQGKTAAVITEPGYKICTTGMDDASHDRPQLIATTTTTTLDETQQSIYGDMAIQVGMALPLDFSHCTIPIVGASHYPLCFFVGFEVKPENIDKAVENSRGMLQRAQERRSMTTATKLVPPSLFVGDARATCLRSGLVDLIVSDLPWGQRESSHRMNCKLYPKLVREVIRLLRVGGRAVLVTGERKLLMRQLEAPFARDRLRLLRTREITIGFKVMVYEIERI